MAAIDFVFLVMSICTVGFFLMFIAYVFRTVAFESEESRLIEELSKAKRECSDMKKKLHRIQAALKDEGD